MTQLVFSPSPHVHTPRTTRGVMLNVLLALLPATACALWYFGLPALEVLLLSVGTCVFTEWFVTKYMLGRPNTIGDFSAVVTGVLLALCLPSSLPWWATVAGGMVSIGIAKMAFGGLGCNIFNPALVGRVFLLISFPVAMTSWPLPDPGFGDADGVTGPTVLELLKHGADSESFLRGEMLVGYMGGSMGEVFSLGLLAGFLYLWVMRIVKIHIPLAMILGLAVVDVFAGFPVGLDIISGGFLLGAFFMATDYVSSPMTARGMWVYGILIGIITAVIRRWGAYPEGVSFAILLMNGATPLINRYMRPRRFSPKRKEVGA